METDPFDYFFRIFYEDTDAGGIVYHARYLAFAERGRSEFLRKIGHPPVQLERERGLSFVVRRLEIAFKAPMHLGDRGLVRTGLGEIRGARIFLWQEVSILSEDGSDPEAFAPAAHLAVELACIRSPDQKPCRIPEDISALFGRLPLHGNRPDNKLGALAGTNGRESGGT